MIYATFQLRSLLFFQSCQQRRQFSLCCISFGRGGISRNVPCLSCKKSTLYLSACTVIAGSTLWNIVLLGKLYDWYVLHLSSIGKVWRRFLLQRYEFLPIPANFSASYCQLLSELSSKIERLRQENWSKTGLPGLCILESETRQIETCHPPFEPKQAGKCPKTSLHPLV